VGTAEATLGTPDIEPPTTAVGRTTVRYSAGALGFSVAVGALEGLSQYLIAKQVADFEETVFQQQWTALQSDIQQAVEDATPKIKETLQETNYHKTIYANIHMESNYVMGVLHTRSGQSWRWAFTGLNFVGVDVSTQDIQRNDKSYTSGIWATWHRPFTYSVPITQPAALVLPAIKVVHNMLAAIRTDLLAIRGGSAGERVALDELTVAQEATDYARPTVFQNRTAAERFHSTLNAIDTSLSVLQSPSGDNPAIENLRGRLWQVQFLLGGLAERWPIMVGKPIDFG
jgi:hypothetical protein